MGPRSTRLGIMVRWSVRFRVFCFTRIKTNLSLKTQLSNQLLLSKMTAPTPSNSPDLDDKTRKHLWLVEAYWYFQRSCSRVASEYRKLFPNDVSPANVSILRQVDKFHDNGTILNLSKGRSGRPRTSTDADNVALVDEFFSENPTASTRRASLVTGIPRTSLRRILKTKLKLFPYKIQVFQELSDFDMERRLEFARKMIDMGLQKSIRTKKIWFSDEAHFWLSGYVNKQNYRFWAAENPRIFETTSMKPQRITVWCAISELGIIGPVFLDQNINGERYKRMLLEEFIPFAQGMGAIDDFWFMQDGALPHRTNDVFESLNEHFPGRVIGLGYASKFEGGLDWPPYSPDLNPCDFFLWGNLKDKVYRHKPGTIDQLKEAIKLEVGSIDRATIKRVVQGFEDRLHAIVETEGAHIEQYLH